MAEESGSGDRTEAATPRRLQRARDAGQLPISREMATFGSLAAVTLVLANSAPALLRNWFNELAVLVQHAATAPLWAPGIWHLAESAVIGPSWLPLAAAGLGGAGAILLQTRGYLRLTALAPQFSRVNPAAGAKRIFGTNGLVEVLRSLGKLIIFSVVAYDVIRSDLSDLRRMPFLAVQALAPVIARAGLHILYAAVLVQSVIAAADLLWTLYHHAQSLRMSKQDIRDEFKETDGNPRIKARMRHIGFARSRRRMMARVPEATVVITNPIHYAVALAYDRATNAAPRVVAKG
ncbi:MAG TPA: EscU/YscU/HrcU family type III secretion system export apparatus switch protein, partial [Rhodopila sp.]|nr:EscU/YscU/HrcU family type III secretion system export apparatus switch protein [Rhodopila sp.]